MLISKNWTEGYGLEGRPRCERLVVSQRQSMRATPSAIPRGSPTPTAIRSSSPLVRRSGSPCGRRGKDELGRSGSSIFGSEPRCGDEWRRPRLACTGPRTRSTPTRRLREPGGDRSIICRGLPRGSADTRSDRCAPGFGCCTGRSRSVGRVSARSDTAGTPAPGVPIIHVNEYRIDHPVRKLGTRPAREPSPIHQPVAPECRRKSGRRIRSRFGRSGSSPRPGRSP